jgi:ribosomal protein S18 acetylase RimI-like enzyme
MTSSLPEGVTVRTLRPEDVGTVAALVAESERHFGLRGQIGPQDVSSWWLRTDLEHDSWLLDDGAGPVATGWLTPVDEWAFAFGSVRPDAKGRGLGGWLADCSEARARELDLGLLRQEAMGVDGGARTLFEGRGYREVRRHYEMAIDLNGEPEEPHVPEPLVIDTFRTEDARAFHAASAESFEDEWGHSPMEFERWWEMRSNDAHFDPSLWFVVRDGDEIAAAERCEEGYGGGYVGLLGVRKPWRRRGLGRALLLHAFREFSRRGFERASLGVDSENPTGATRLYESVGMHVESEFVTFEKELA